MRRTEGPFAFLRGIHGIGEARAETLYAALGEDCFQKLLDDPWQVALGFAKDTYDRLGEPGQYGGHSIVQGVESLLLWSRFLGWITRPLLAIDTVTTRHSRPLRTIEESEALALVGRAINDGLLPSFWWKPVHRFPSNRAEYPMADKNPACLFRYLVAGTAVYGAYSGRHLCVYFNVPFDRRWAWVSQF